MTLRDRLRHARAARQRGQLISLRLDGVERLAGFLDDDVLAVDVDGHVQFFSAVDRRIDWTDSSPTIDFSAVRVRGEPIGRSPYRASDRVLRDLETIAGSIVVGRSTSRF